MKSMLGHAISITSEAFKDRTDKGGVPYIMHCLYVMNHVDGDDDLKCAAVMHDLVEDTDETSPINWTFESLEEYGFSKRVITLLRYVTHDPKHDYMVYIAIIAHDLDAIKIKKADLQHNSCITRLKGVKPKDHKRIEKYNESYMFLLEAEETLKAKG